jgi:hypothetical protein
MRTVRVEKVAKAANTHCIPESWLILSLLNVALSGTHSRLKGISPNRSPQDGRAIGLSWTAMVFDRVFVVTHPNSSGVYADLVDRRVGVLALTKSGSLKLIKDTQSNAANVLPK